MGQIYLNEDSSAKLTVIAQKSRVKRSEIMKNLIDEEYQDVDVFRIRISSETDVCLCKLAQESCKKREEYLSDLIQKLYSLEYQIKKWDD